METNTKIAELKALAKQKEDEAKQRAVEEEESSNQSKIDAGAEKLYQEREESLRRQQEIDKIAKTKEAAEQKVAIYEQELEGNRLEGQEAQGKLSSNDTPEEAKAVYELILAEVQKEETRISKELEEARGGVASLDSVNVDSKEYIDTTTKDAAEILGFGEAKVHQVLDYIQSERAGQKLLQDQEVIKDLASTLLHSDSNPNFAKEWIKKKLPLLQEMSKHPSVIKAVRQALDAYGYGGNGAWLEFEDENGKMTSLARQMEKVRQQESIYAKFTPEQKQIIEEAVTHPEKTIDEIGKELSAKYDSNILGKIQEDALKENAEFDNEKQKAKEIRGLESNIESNQDSIKSLERILPIKTMVEEYDTLTRAHDSSQEEERTRLRKMQKELSVFETDLEKVENDKTIFGNIKDKNKQTKIKNQIEGIKSEIESLESKYNQTDLEFQKSKLNFLEQLALELKKNNKYPDGTAKDALSNASKVINGNRWGSSSIETIKQKMIDLNKEITESQARIESLKAE